MHEHETAQLPETIIPQERPGRTEARMFRHEFPQIPKDSLPQGNIPGIRRLTRTVGDPNWHYALHEHEDAMEFMFVAGGVADIVLDQQLVTVRAGDVLLIGEGVPHSIASRVEDPSDVWTFTAVRTGFVGHSGKIEAVHTQAGENGEFIAQTMSRLEEFSKRSDLPSRVACDYLCSALLALFSQSMSQPSVPGKARNKALPSSILKYINENYAQDIGLAMLANIFGASASHISREFKRSHNISPVNYLIDKRLSEAKWQLINTDDPVWCVAERVGYQNVYYFTKLFSGRVGESPTEYRRKYGKE